MGPPTTASSWKDASEEDRDHQCSCVFKLAPSQDAFSLSEEALVCPVHCALWPGSLPGTPPSRSFLSESRSLGMSHSLVLIIPSSQVRPHPFSLPAPPLGHHLPHVSTGRAPQSCPESPLSVRPGGQCGPPSSSSLLGAVWPPGWATVTRVCPSPQRTSPGVSPNKLCLPQECQVHFWVCPKEEEQKPL